MSSPGGAEEDLARLYVITGGRSYAGRACDLLDLVETRRAVGLQEQGEAAAILRLCRRPQTVVEISDRLRLPVTVIAILLADLVDCGAVTVRPPHSVTSPRRAAGPAAGNTAGADARTTRLLERVRDGLLKLA
jgi:hypothetical protein